MTNGGLGSGQASHPKLMFLTCVSGHLLSAPTLLKETVTSQAAISVDLAVPKAETPDMLEVGLLCERFLVRRIMRFVPGDVITVDGYLFGKKVCHQDEMVTELMLDVTRILSIESRELMALNWNDPKAFEAWRARNIAKAKDR